MSDLDIVADLDAAPRRPKGSPCRIAEMRRDRPELLAQWDLVVPLRRYSAGDVARWFVARDFPMTRNVVERHRNHTTYCAWCEPGREVTA